MISCLAVQDFVAKYNMKHSETPLEVLSLCARTDGSSVVKPDVKVGICWQSCPVSG